MDLKATSGGESGMPPQTGRPKSSRRRRRLRLAGIIVGGIIIVLAIASFATAEYTSRSSFCNSCHEMNPYYDSWQASVHTSAECRDCHIPPGFIAYVKTKLFSLREVWVHVTGQPEAPLAVTREIPDANCLDCHPDPGEISPAAPATVGFSHQIHEDRNCIGCHIRVVHRAVNPPYYVDPGAMSSCLECHDGTSAPATCSTCHTPPHEPRGECGDCHSTQSWTGGAFEHPFALTGAHANLDCTDCHVSKPGVETIPGYNLPRADPACSSCHTPPHEPRGECSDCHNTQSFADVTFEHPFALTGAHANLDCTDCHVSKPGVETIPGYDLPKADPACISCHGDHHQGLTDCADCHTPEGWSPANFNHPQVGEHIPSGEHRLDCAQCHPNGYGTHSCAPCHQGTPSGGD